MSRIRYSALGTCLIASLALTACGGGSGGSTPKANSTSAPATAPANPTAAAAQVKQVYTTFFSASPAKAKTLLQDGSQLGTAIRMADKLKAGGTEKARVKSVSFTSPTAATVSYALSVNGHVALPTATGQAVLVNGRWLVAKTTFCTLVTLGVGSGKKVPGCSP